MGLEDKAIISPGDPGWDEMTENLPEIFRNLQKIRAEAPRYDLTPREIHVPKEAGGGYHAHTLYRKGSKFWRSGHIVTLFKDEFYIWEHGCKGRTLFNAENVMASLVSELGQRLGDVFSSIPYDQLQSPASGALKIMDLESVSSCKADYG
ncbi:hypothetical protein GF345_05340 [Candidatus Woesearchaeota archaeon]|nr:hypothetical protein [Candidatus Woesearchaeota archaeon]